MIGILAPLICSADLASSCSGTSQRLFAASVIFTCRRSGTLVSTMSFSVLMSGPNSGCVACFSSRSACKCSNNFCAMHRIGALTDALLLVCGWSCRGFQKFQMATSLVRRLMMYDARSALAHCCHEIWIELIHKDKAASAAAVVLSQAAAFASTI